jgi:outer membrane receptor protein involved in Fe transport
MKIKFLVFALFLTLSNLFAQEKTGSVAGKIIDSKTKEGIGFSTVKIKDGTQLIANVITKEDGSFSFSNLELKSYILEINFVGYKKYSETIELTTSKKSVTITTINLESESKEIEGVTIVKERSTIEQKADRKVVNVGKDLIASGATASDIFNNIPTVSIDPQTKELSLRGNSNVRVFVDGKPTNIDATQLLQQIPSASIKQIELITNPSAKYNPDGNSGIINIILYKNSRTGFNGSLTSGVTFGVTPKTNQSLNLNYKVGKVNFYTNYGFNHGKNRNYGYVNSERPSLENYQSFNFSNINTSHLLKLGADYYINDNNTLSFFTNLNFFDGKGDSNTVVDFFNNTTNTDVYQKNWNNSGNFTYTYDLNYKHNFKKKGETIEFQANHSVTDNSDLSHFLDNSISSTNDISGKTNYSQFNIDYVNPLSETSKLELGYESRIQGGKNNFADFSTTYSDLNTFDFNRNIHAIYANFSESFGKFNAQVGARAEQYDLFAHPVKISSNSANNQNAVIRDAIFTIYPSAYLTYKMDDNNTFNLNYTRRVDRPSNGQINPIREWRTPQMESRGNPALEPQFTNSFEVNYTKNTKIGSITSAVFYRMINAEISRVIYSDATNPNYNILSFNNFKNNHSVGAEISANLRLTKWWFTNASADVYFKTVRGTVTNLTTNLPENGEVKVTTFNTRLNNTFSASKNLKFNLFGMYRGRDLSLQYARTPMYRIDFGANYTILKGKGTLSARLNDMFNMMHFGFDGNIPYKQVGEFHWESRTFYLGFNYNFGGGKNKELQRKQRDKNETQSGGMF